MKKIIFFLICLSCIFALSQCDKSEIVDNDILPIEPTEPAEPIEPTEPIEPWNYSNVAFIARITDNSSDWSLCIIDTSNNMRKIVEMKTTCQKPVRSCLGTQLLFTTYASDDYCELYSVNTDGTGLTLIDRINNGYLSYADWSPDDKQIVYTKTKLSSDGRNKSDLIIYNTSDGTHKIVNVLGEEKHNPKFSPNGMQIAYCATVPSDTLFMFSHRNHHIFIVDVNGENNSLLIEEASAPKWSPLGNKIVYLSSGLNGSSQIFVANSDGNNQQQLTSSVAPGLWDSGFPRNGNEDPQWTLDGNKIVYVSWENGKAEIFIINADGSNKTQLTTAEFRDDSPEVTPDGQYILFSSRRSDMMNNGICVMALDGNNQQVLSNVGCYPVACK